MKKVIVRMPPSPTGGLHLGTVRTLLFNFLWARKNDGKIIFRWEDTDQERSEKKWETEILHGLEWLGIGFDEMTRQSEQADFHGKKLQEMWEDGKVFPCFETPENIDKQRTIARENKKNFVWWSPWRDEKKEILQEKIDNEESFVWRFKTPKNQDIVFQDHLRGEIKVSTETIGDFAVARSNNSVLYLLANALDDIKDGITWIMRGDDHVSNTPKQILIFQALDAEIPQYVHIPLVLDLQRKKLSKRNLQAGVCILLSEFEEAGFLPVAVCNGLSLLGWNPKTEEELFSQENLQNKFNLEGLNNAGSCYDFAKMKWINGQWARKLSTENPAELVENFTKWLEISNWTTEQKQNWEKISAEKQQAILFLGMEKCQIFVELYDEIDFFLEEFTPQKDLIINEKMKIDNVLARKVLSEIINMLENISEKEFSRENLRIKAVEKIAELGLKNGQFLWPWRVAVSGKSRSAGPFEICEILGKEDSLVRLKANLSVLN